MAASSKVRDRAADIEQQKTGAGIQQMQNADFGAYKNEPIADPWQGALPLVQRVSVMQCSNVSV